MFCFCFSCHAPMTKAHMVLNLIKLYFIFYHFCNRVNTIPPENKYKLFVLHPLFINFFTSPFICILRWRRRCRWKRSNVKSVRATWWCSFTIIHTFPQRLLIPREQIEYENNTKTRRHMFNTFQELYSLSFIDQRTLSLSDLICSSQLCPREGNVLLILIQIYFYSFFKFRPQITGSLRVAKKPLKTKLWSLTELVASQSHNYTTKIK